MAVSFTRHGRLHYLDPGACSPRVGEHVLVPTETGPEVAECIWAPQEVEGVDGLPVCLGRADPTDLHRDEANRAFVTTARVAARHAVRAVGLPMKIIGVDYLDGRQGGGRAVVVYFSAPGRVDFRELVRLLARTLDARVELRQVGARDEARLVGGIGPCGREMCCSTFLKDFEPVTVRMAKEQDLPLNPLKISGACGRLMCCLNYEHPLYEAFHAAAPSLGERVDTPDGPGAVVGYNVPSDSVVVRIAETGRRSACPRASVCPSHQAYRQMHTSGSGGAPVPVDSQP